MKKVKNYYIVTADGKRTFQHWLINHSLSLRKFAARCGVSAVYISLVMNGKSHVTAKAREIFKKGGYEIL